MISTRSAGLLIDTLYASHLLSGRPCPVGSGAISRKKFVQSLAGKSATMWPIRRKRRAVRSLVVDEPSLAAEGLSVIGGATGRVLPAPRKPAAHEPSQVRWEDGTGTLTVIRPIETVDSVEG